MSRAQCSSWGRGRMAARTVVRAVEAWHKVDRPHRCTDSVREDKANTALSQYFRSVSSYRVAALLPGIGASVCTVNSINVHLPKGVSLELKTDGRCNKSATDLAFPAQPLMMRTVFVLAIAALSLVHNVESFAPMLAPVLRSSVSVAPLRPVRFRHASARFCMTASTKQSPLENGEQRFRVTPSYIHGFSRSWVHFRELTSCEQAEKGGLRRKRGASVSGRASSSFPTRRCPSKPAALPLSFSAITHLNPEFVPCQTRKSEKFACVQCQRGSYIRNDAGRWTG
eukprot:901974-Rhodomonas_salina.1